MFFGVYETKVSTLALCHLLSHCVATGDQRLTQLLVVGGKEGVHGGNLEGTLVSIGCVCLQGHSTLLLMKFTCQSKS